MIDAETLFGHMAVTVDGEIRQRPVVMRCGRETSLSGIEFSTTKRVPEVYEGEQLVETIDGLMFIVTVRKS